MGPGELDTTIGPADGGVEEVREAPNGYREVWVTTNEVLSFASQEEGYLNQAAKDMWKSSVLPALDSVKQKKAEFGLSSTKFLKGRMPSAQQRLPVKEMPTEPALEVKDHRFYNTTIMDRIPPEREHLVNRPQFQGREDELIARKMMEEIHREEQVRQNNMAAIMAQREKFRKATNVYMQDQNKEVEKISRLVENQEPDYVQTMDVYASDDEYAVGVRATPEIEEIQHSMTDLSHFDDSLRQQK